MKNDAERIHSYDRGRFLPYLESQFASHIANVHTRSDVVLKTTFQDHSASRLKKAPLDKENASLLLEVMASQNQDCPHWHIPITKSTFILAISCTSRSHNSLEPKIENKILTNNHRHDEVYYLCLLMRGDDWMLDLGSFDCIQRKQMGS